MCSEQLLKFNTQFPDSRYREINAQYVGPMETEDERKKYQESKRPINTKALNLQLKELFL